MSFPLIHKVALWIETFTGSLSALSSSLIIYMMWSDREFKLKRKPNNRILLSMSIIDVFQSIAYALHSVPLPPSTGVYHASGNRYTCATQGFFVQLGLAVPAYNASLCIWNLMVIKYNMREEDFAKKIEPYCHAWSILVPLTSACVIAGLDHFSQRGYICWIGNVKHGFRFGDFFVILSSVQIAIAFIVVIYCLLRVYCTIYQLEQQMKQYSLSPSGMQWTSNSNTSGLASMKKDFAKQITLFSGAFFLTFFFTGINNTFYGFHNDIDDLMSNGNKLPLFLPQCIFLPLQGFWNLIIYTRPVILRITRQYPEFKTFAAIHMMIFYPGQVRPRISGRGRRRSFGALGTNAPRRRASLGVPSPPTASTVNRIKPRKRLSLPSNWMSLVKKKNSSSMGNSNDANADANADAEININAINTSGTVQEDIQRAVEELKLEEGGYIISKSDDSLTFRPNSDFTPKQTGTIFNNDLMQNANNTARSQMQEDDIQGALEELNKLEEGGDGINDNDNMPPFHPNSNFAPESMGTIVSDQIQNPPEL